MYPDWKNEGLEETTGRWSHEQKEKWLLDMVYELAKIKGSNIFDLTLEDVMSPIEVLNDPTIDDPYTLFFADEQRKLLDFFVFQNLLKIEEEIDKYHIKIRLIEKSRRLHSMYFDDGCKTLRDVTLNTELKHSLLSIILRAYGVSNAREIDRRRHVKTDVDERLNDSYQDEKILLLEELGMVKADWEGLKSQTHRTIGNRLISVYFDGEKVGDFVDIILGKKSFIDIRALEHIATLMKDWMSMEKWQNFFSDQGVPATLMPGNPIKKGFIHETLLALCSTGDERDKKIVEKIFSELVHPLMHDGSESTAHARSLEISKYLKHNDFGILNGRFQKLNEEQKKQLFELEKNQSKRIDEALAGIGFFGDFFKSNEAPHPKSQKQQEQDEKVGTIKTSTKTVKDFPYKGDGLFYSLWKYANAKRLTKKNLISFADLLPLSCSAYVAIGNFLQTLQELGVQLEGARFHAELFKHYCPKEHSYLNDLVAKVPNKQFAHAIGQLLKNQFTWDDLLSAFGTPEGMFLMNPRPEGIFEFIEFSPAPSETNILPVRQYLDDYIEAFTADALVSYDTKNFYRFARQKEIFLDQRRQDIENYGTRFIFKGRNAGLNYNTALSLKADEEYLFIHTLAALEKEELYKIEEIFIVDMDMPPERQTDDYKVKIIVNKKILEEVAKLHTHTSENKVSNDTVPKTEIHNHITTVVNPMTKSASIAAVELEKQTLKDKNIRFDEQTGKLIINNKPCSLPPYKNEYYLCRAMFQHPAGEPVEWQDVYDEIFRSVERNAEKAKDTKENRRPVYDAMRAVNQRIQKLYNTEDELFSFQEKTLIRHFGK